MKKKIKYYAPVINFPDYQARIYKNDPKIKWVKPVHEVIEGHETQTMFPLDANFAILHIKEITRQEKQNDFYETI